MKTIFNFVVLFLSTTSCIAAPYQAVVINDPDGFTNIRADRSPGSAVLAKVGSAEVFYALPISDAWWQVTTQDGKSGYMSKSRIALVPPSRNADSLAKRPTPADMSPTDTPSDPVAQNALGMKYFYGTGVPINKEKSAYWLRMAAEQDSIDAKANLGRLYIDGEGIHQDRSFGLALLREGLAKGNPHAQALYGAYVFKLSFDPNAGLSQKNRQVIAEAMSWLGKAAAQGGEDGARAAWGLKTFKEAYKEETRAFMVSQFMNALSGGNASSNSSSDWSDQKTIFEMQHGR